MQINAYAKINWYLRILSKDNYGYHKIATVFQSVSLKDTVIFKKIKSGFKFTANADDIPKDSGNLVLKAIEALCNRIKKIPTGLDIILKKNIPIKAGLGGGSADAAATLKALNILWGLKLSNKELISLAQVIGSDVPFNIIGGLAYAAGRGEKLEFYKMPAPAHLLIIKPDIGIPTKWAYEEFDKLNTEKSKHIPPRQEINKLIKAIQNADFENIKKYAVNDFEKIVYGKYPHIEKIKNDLIKHGAVAALLCGSGSAVFGLFENKKDQEKAYKVLIEQNRGLASQKLRNPVLQILRCLTL